ncbi:MAG TPA: hypothetical protein VD963_06685 [Phycisphaerales bacterium]|nr:hypothetical protein [Phycisphaerales bacterium]
MSGNCEARRDEILCLMLRAGRRRRQRRAAWRGAVGTISVVTVVYTIAGLLPMRRAAPALPGRAVSLVVDRPFESQEGAGRGARSLGHSVQIVRSDPGILDRVRLTPNEGVRRVLRVGDREFLDLLRERGDAGLIRVGDRATVIARGRAPASAPAAVPGPG